MLETKEKPFSKKAYSVKNVAEQMDVSIPFVRKEIRNGNLKAKKCGTRTLVLDSELTVYLEKQQDWKPSKNLKETN